MTFEETRFKVAKNGLSRWDSCKLNVKKVTLPDQTTATRENRAAPASGRDANDYGRNAK
jgi:hypothetical protein